MANSSLLIVTLLFLTLNTNLSCQISGYLKSKSTKKCNRSDGAECCKAGKSYAKYECSPPVSDKTQAVLTFNDFQKGGDGGGAADCDHKYHSNNGFIVALSTGWYANRSRCGKNIKITSLRNGKSVLATVVDECDSAHGCVSEQGNQPPCANNIVDGSKAVWKALGLDTDVGKESITWSPYVDTK